MRILKQEGKKPGRKQFQGGKGVAADVANERLRLKSQAKKTASLLKAG